MATGWKGRKTIEARNPGTIGRVLMEMVVGGVRRSRGGGGGGGGGGEGSPLASDERLCHFDLLNGFIPVCPNPLR